MRPILRPAGGVFMETGVIVALCVFGALALIAVIAAVVVAASVSSTETRSDED